MVIYIKQGKGKLFSSSKTKPSLFACISIQVSPFVHLPLLLLRPLLLLPLCFPTSSASLSASAIQACSWTISSSFFLSSSALFLFSFNFHKNAYPIKPISAEKHLIKWSTAASKKQIRINHLGNRSANQSHFWDTRWFWIGSLGHLLVQDWELELGSIQYCPISRAARLLGDAHICDTVAVWQFGW